MSTLSLESQLASFIGKYTPEVAAQVRGARTKLRGIFPRGYELVYDNYNALVFGFSPTQRSSDAVLSIAAYPRWVSLFFLQGAKLVDPHGMLKGSGGKVRHLVLS